MDVKTLIELLQQMPQDAPVFASGDGGWEIIEINAVKVDKGKFGVADPRCLLSDD